MKRFHVTTFGCQMNEHDSERMRGMLTSLGYAEAPAREDADLILFNTTAGRLHLEGAPRTVTAETLDGNVEVAGPVTSLRVRTAGGTVVLRGTRGGLTVTTVSGAILVGGARTSRARLETVSGEIAWKGAIERGGSLDTQTHSGNIELRLPPALGADLELSAPAGNISSEFTLKASPAPAARSAPASATGELPSRPHLPGQDLPCQAAGSGRKPRGAGRHLRTSRYSP